MIKIFKSKFERGFSLRDFTVHSDGAILVDVGVVFYICYSGLLLLCIIIILFILWLIYFIHSVFRTHISSCVRGGIKHP
jgi:hypothetical protein